MSQATWPDVLTTLSAGAELTAAQAAWAMSQVLEGAATPAQISAFSVLLRAKRETPAELVVLIDTMLEHATPIELPQDVVDIVGTGGDRVGTVNISTMSGIVAAGAGARVVKHGNRAASSKSGAADVLEALGVSLTVPPERQREVLDTSGIVFLFAPMYHPSFRFAGPVRKEIGVPTMFNILGPLGNPARPRSMAFGIADATIAPTVADVLVQRGVRGMVFHGRDGLDELTSTTSSQVWMLRAGEVSEALLDVHELGLPPARPEDLLGGDARHNAEVARRVLAGENGPVRDVVLLNAAAALVAASGLDGRPLAEQFVDKIRVAAHSIDSGAAAGVLDRWVKASQDATPTAS